MNLNRKLLRTIT